MRFEAVKLSEVADIIVGFAFKSQDFNTNGIGVRLVRGKNITRRSLRWGEDTRWWNDFSFNLDRYYLREKDIVIGMDGSLVGKNYAKINASDLPLLLVQRVACIRAKEEVSQDYLWQIIATPLFENYIDAVKTGTTIPHISGKQIGEYEIPYCNAETQERIASILSVTEEKIRLNTAINENLELQAQAIFKSWFLDFEPFGGVMPEDWRTGSLSEICGYSKDKVNIEDLTLDTYYSTENMQPNRQGAVQATALPTIKQTIACKKGDVLISNIRPYFKKIIYCFADCGCSTDVLCFVPNKSEYSAFLYCALYSDKFFDYMVAGSKGTKMPRGDKQQIMMYPICIPSTEYVEQFSKIVAPMLETVYTNRLEANDLAILRDTLLPKLMKGEIDVSEVKI